MSNKVNVDTEIFECVTLFGDKPALFTPFRVDRLTVPDGWYCYDIRYDDDGDPCSIENFVWVNHWGSLISKDPIDIPDGGLDAQEVLSFVPTGDTVYFTFEEFSKYLGEKMKEEIK